MMTPMISPAECRPGSVTRVYRRVMGWLTIGWLAVAALTGLVLLQSPQLVEFAEAAWIAIASLLIAYISMIPGLIGESIASWSRDNSPDPVQSTVTISPSGHFYGVLLAGIMIRLLGTVALFLTCRYQMASSAGSIAAMTIGWYVWLTTIEVVAVVRELPSCMDQAAACQSGNRSPSAS